MDGVGNGCRLYILGNLNGWLGGRVRAGITFTLGVSRESDNGRRVVEFCAERELCVSNTYFEHKSLHKYTKRPRWSVGKDHDRPGACEEGYSAFCAGCEASERNETRHLR